MKKILIIEDEASIRENTQEILEIKGFQVLTAANGAIGLQTARIKLPDLILCDIMMPELNGYEVLAALHKNSNTAAIPLIFLTAKAEQSALRQGMNLGADDYLTKPFTAEELLGAINGRLQRRERFKQPHNLEQQTKKLRQEIIQNKQQLEESHQMDILKNELLQKLFQDLRSPLSNINMTIHLLKGANSEEERKRYLKILQEEYTREIQIINEVEELQKLLTPGNVQLLKRFKLLNN